MKKANNLKKIDFKEFFKAATDELIKTIRLYESNTFFAKGCNLTEDEIFEIAARLIHNMINNDLDGEKLDYQLDRIRGL